jgi:predicted amidohydrolase
VQAVACFFPPTDLLNWGESGKALIRATDHAPPFRAAFDYRELDKASMLWVPITDEGCLRQIAREISPITHVSADDPPTLILHGDADKLVPLQQSQEIVEALQKAGVKALLVVKEGAGHGWPAMVNDMGAFADWFDGHLKNREPNTLRNPVSQSPSPLPEPWSHKDIGDVSVPGDARFADGTFTITGTLDIWGKADGFHFVYQPLDGDAEIIARVTAVENTNQHAKAGVMIRESLKADARHATMVVTPVDGTQFLRRHEPGGLTTNTNPERHRGQLPYWVKLVRKGDEFTAYESADGQDWVRADTDTVPMSGRVYIGLVASSHQKMVTNTSKITNVRLTTARPANAQTKAERPPRKVVIGTVVLGSYSKASEFDERLKRLGGLIDAMARRASQNDPAHGLDLAILPETAVTPSEGPASARARPLAGPVAETFGALARKHKTYIIAPMDLVEEGPKGTYYSNAAVLFDRKGEVAGIYRKVHPVALVGRNDLEDGITPGRDYPVFDCDFGKLGIQICWDIQFDEGWQALADKGAEIVVWPSASPATVLPAARAARHRYYVISSTWRNNATIYEPTGMVAAQVRERGQVLVHQLDLSFALLGWTPFLHDGQALTEKVGYHYEPSEDLGLFWSNDPTMTIGAMIRSLGLEEIDAQVERNRKLQAAARGGPAE